MINKNLSTFKLIKLQLIPNLWNITLFVDDYIYIYSFKIVINLKNKYFKKIIILNDMYR